MSLDDLWLWSITWKHSESSNYVEVKIKDKRMWSNKYVIETSSVNV